MDSRNALKTLLQRFSVKHGTPGQFQLVSGKRSDWYVDGKLTTCRAEAIPLVGQAFLAKIRERGWRAQAVGGLVIGADPIVMAIARESVTAPPLVNAFLVRKEPKKHGTQKFIEGLEGVESLDVVIIDDVCTTGDSTKNAIEAARQAGFRVTGALCLVDREEGAEELMRQLDCPFDRIFTLRELQDADNTGKLAGAGSTQSNA